MVEFNKLVSKARDSISEVMKYIEHNPNVYEYLTESIIKDNSIYSLSEKDVAEFIIEVYADYNELTEPINKGE